MSLMLPTDGCPKCISGVPNHPVRRDVDRVEGFVVAQYHCGHCGHNWWTGWDISALNLPCPGCPACPNERGEVA